jgi:ABC-type spermidine/putrescine transport system permease subunit I
VHARTLLLMRWQTAPDTTEEWEQPDDPRLYAGLGGLNVLLYAAGELLGLTDLVGVCLALSLFALMGAYLVWEREQRRGAIALALGTLPFWVTLLLTL